MQSLAAPIRARRKIAESTLPSVPEDPLPSIGTWLREVREVMFAGAQTTVRCGTCTACCRSHASISLQPGEEALATGRLADGTPAILCPDRICPNLTEHGCGIYERRPAACRIYDCRQFAYAGFVPAGRAVGTAVQQRWPMPSRGDVCREPRDRERLAALRSITRRELAREGTSVDRAVGAALGALLAEEDAALLAATHEHPSSA